MRKLSMDELNRKTVEEFREAGKIPIIAILENVRSAYNVGSVFRTADAFLLEAIYICGYTAYPPHKEIKKTALGAEETVRWKHFKHIGEAIKELRDDGYRIYSVEQDTIALTDGCIEIPQLGMKHSLNISVAAGVVLWELVRRRISNKEQGISNDEGGG